MSLLRVTLKVEIKEERSNLLFFFTYFHVGGNKVKKIVEIYRTHYEVHNYKIGDNEKLEHFLSTWDFKSYKYVPYYQYDKDSQTLYLSKGINFPLLKENFKDADFIHMKSENKISEAIFNMNYTPKNANQLKSIQFLISEGKFYGNKNETQFALILPTNSGKTFCAVSAIHELKCKALIVVHNKDIRDQWVERILEYTDITQDEICIFTSSAIIDKVAKNSDKYKIFIVTHSLTTSYMKGKGDKKLNDVMSKIGIGIKIIDECHKCFTNIIRLDNALDIRYNFYLTATFGRTPDDLNKVYQRVFHDVCKFKLDNQDFNRDKNVIYRGVLFNTHPQWVDINRMFTVLAYDKDKKPIKTFNVFKYIQYQLKKKLLERLVVNEVGYMMNKLSDGSKIAIISPLKESCKYFANKVKSKFPELNVAVHTSDGKVEDISEYDVICATAAMIGTGNDIEDLRGLINTTPLNSKINIKQLVGRLGRGDDKNICIFSDIVDKKVPSAYKMYINRTTTMKPEILKLEEINA